MKLWTWLAGGVFVPLLLMGCGGGTMPVNLTGGTPPPTTPSWNGLGGNPDGSHQGLGPGAKGKIIWSVTDTAIPFSVTSTGLLVAGKAAVGTGTPAVEARIGATGIKKWEVPSPQQFGLLDGNGDLLMGLKKLKADTGATLLQNLTASSNPRLVGIDARGTIYGLSGTPLTGLSNYTLSPVDLYVSSYPYPFLSLSFDGLGHIAAGMVGGNREVIGSIPGPGWSVPLTLAGGHVSRPAFGKSGFVYAVAYDANAVYAACIDPVTGIPLWKQTLYTSPITGSSNGVVKDLAIGPEGNIYVSVTGPGIGTDSGTFLCLSPVDGSVIWSKAIGAGDPIAAADGTVYIHQTSTKKLLAFSAKGILLWGVNVGGPASAIIQGSDGTLFLNAGGNIVAVQ